VFDGKIKFPFFSVIKPVPPTREPCKFCGTDQEGTCGFYYEDLCPDANPADMEKARERAREEDS